MRKQVKVIVDRPIGSFHPNYKDLYYPINYGYVEGIDGADGEFQDAYIIGIMEPLKEFIGDVVAVIHRFDDVEDKWVVAPRDTTFSKNEIRQYVHFQEQYFQYEIIMTQKYYEAYNERYKIVHQQGARWSSDIPTPIVLDVLKRYGIENHHSILEIGCGEGRDAKAVLESGYSLLATDISKEAISYCRDKFPSYDKNFRVLDCISENLSEQFDVIYAVALIHMLVLDEDRDAFYQFVCHHLKPNGIALICSMGNGETEYQSDISTAFELQERNHETGKMMVAGTSCRMVNFETFENEIIRNGLNILEKGITNAMPDFNELMYVVVTK